MRNFRPEDDMCILEKSLTAGWRQSWMEEKFELGNRLRSDCKRSGLCSDKAVTIEERDYMENYIKIELTQ